MSQLKNIFIKWFGQTAFTSTKRILDGLIFSYKKIIYSQNGEDCFIENYFKGKKNGTYIDVGSFHPKQFSNTFKLYDSYHWSGISIDARPGSSVLFNKIRPRDLAIETPISNIPTSLEYFSWGDHSENTMDPAQANALEKTLGPPLKVITMQTRTLKSILDSHLEKNKIIDLMSVDVEGLDLEVLKSNDWKSYRPKLLVVEIFTDKLSLLRTHPVFKFLEENNYEMVGWLNPSVIFEDQLNRD